MKNKLNGSQNERFYRLQIEDKEGKGWLKRNSNRPIIIETDADGILLGYHFETPAAEIALPPAPVVAQPKSRKETRVYTPAQIEQIMRHFWEGMPISTIAKTLHVNHDSLVSYLGRLKTLGKIYLTAQQSASVHKMLETCSDSEKIAKTVKLPLCMVREVKRAWSYKVGATFGLSVDDVKLIVARSSTYTPTELRRKGYKMPTLAAQVGLSLVNLGTFLKLIR